MCLNLLKFPSPLVPDSATEAMSTPCFCDMYPRMEKMAKPDKKLVPLFNRQSKKESLQFSKQRSVRLLDANNLQLYRRQFDQCHYTPSG